MSFIETDVALFDAFGTVFPEDNVRLVVPVKKVYNEQTKTNITKQDSDEIVYEAQLTKPKTTGHLEPEGSGTGAGVGTTRQKEYVYVDYKITPTKPRITAGMSVELNGKEYTVAKDYADFDDKGTGELAFEDICAITTKPITTLGLCRAF